MKPTKINLKRIIKWSRSKRSYMKKDEVIDDIYNKIKKRKKGKWEYSTSISTDRYLPLLVIKYQLVIKEDIKIIIIKYRRGSSWNSKSEKILLK